MCLILTFLFLPLPLPLIPFFYIIRFIAYIFLSSFLLFSKCLSSLHYFFHLFASPLPFLLLSVSLFHLAISFRPFTPASFFLCRSSSSISVKGAAALINTICKIRARNLCMGKQSESLYYQKT